MASEMKYVKRIFVMVDTDPGKDVKVEELLMKFDEIFEVHYVSGEYDILAVADIQFHGSPAFSQVQELSHILIQKIREIPGVRDTNSLVPFRSLAKKRWGE